jgi:hypothetical protein
VLQMQRVSTLLETTHACVTVATPGMVSFAKILMSAPQSIAEITRCVITQTGLFCVNVLQDTLDSLLYVLPI